MEQGAAELLIELTALPDSDSSEMLDDTQRLRAELLDLDIEDAAIRRIGLAPAGAKAADPAGLGQILLALAASGGVLTALIAAISDWLARNAGRSVKISFDGDTLEISGRRTQAEDHLISQFLARHAEPGAQGEG